MTAPVLLAEAKLFLRVEHDAEDGLIQTLIDAARARVEGEVGLSLLSTSPAPLRLAWRSEAPVRDLRSDPPTPAR